MVKAVDLDPVDLMGPPYGQYVLDTQPRYVAGPSTLAEAIRNKPFDKLLT